MTPEHETKLLEAHQAGVAYWRANEPIYASPNNLASHARSCGWHDDLCDAWVAGFLGARSRWFETFLSLQ